MKVKEIIELIDFISKKKLEEVKVETAEIKLSVKKTGGSRVIEQQVYTNGPMTAAAPQVSAPEPPKPTSDASTPKETSAAPANNYITIKSPMIGTFYRTPDPESPVFANVGDTISVGQTICIIEAMKLFNEIEADVSGKVVEVLVENATPVEFDQPLFVIDPS